MKVKLCEIVQRIDYITENDILNGIEKGAIKDYAYILHDKENTTAHYHVAIRLKYAYDTKYIAEWFGVPENCVEKVKGKWSDMLQYLTHQNAPEKYQYEETEVHANFDWKAESVVQSLDTIIGLIADGTIREYNQTENIDPVTYSKYATRIKSAFEYRRLKVMLDQNRDIQVMFFEGAPGVGKTSLAKLTAKSIGNGSVFVSGSSNDPMQGYAGQDTIVFDDMRDDAFPYTDFLKILDNHTGSAIRSRYNNKVFIGKCIMITSYRPVKDWYQGVPGEAKGQLFRRITFVYKIDRETIRSYRIDEDGNEIFQGSAKNLITVIHKAKTITTFDQWKDLMVDAINSVDLSDDVKKDLEKSIKTGVEGFEEMEDNPEDIF